jgi:CHAT domain-containing protein
VDSFANTVEGWAPAVLNTGGAGYIGALWPIGDNSAKDFSIQFYQDIQQHLASNQANIAETLTTTKRKFFNAQNNDLTSLAYVYYGDPNLVFTK